MSDGLKKLAEAATPGPWTTEPHGKTTALYSGRGQWHHGLRLLNLDDGDWNFENNRAFIAAANPAAVLNLIRERDEAREQCDSYRLAQSLDKDSAYVIRELLNRHNVPPAAFIDDHVANAIAQRDAAEAALSAAREEVERLQRWLDYTERELVAAMERGQLHHSLHVLITGTKDPTDG